MAWYRVIKTIKGHRYVYDQQTYREGGQVRTLNRYIGRADDAGGSSGSADSAQANAQLFRNAGDFGRAMVEQFDAATRVEDLGQQLLGGESQRIRPPAVKFDFDKSVSYDTLAKRRFHAAARRRLKALAGALGLTSGEFDLRSNMGGIAVSGEVTLHADDLYVQVSQSSLGSNAGIMYRSCEGRHDYTGGNNHFASVDLLNDPEELARVIRQSGRN